MIPDCFFNKIQAHMTPKKTLSTKGTKRTPHSDTTVIDYVNSQISLLSNAGRLGTAHNYTRTRNSLQAFLKGRDIPLRKFDETLVMEYSGFLMQRGVVRNTASFYMRILRAIYNKAVRKNIVTQTYPFRNVYTGIDKTRKRALDEMSLIKLLTLDLEGKPALKLSRDLFLFSFCTRGMSFIDIALLRKTDCTGSYITYRRHKTGQFLTILIEPCIKNIMDRYADRTKDTPYIFPIVSSVDQEAVYRQYQTSLGYHNRKLKVLARMTGVNIHLSSYCARHTWATVARNRNIPVSVIAAAMGHSSEKTTLIYLDSLENSVIDQANRQVLESLHGNVSP